MRKKIEINGKLGVRKRADKVERLVEPNSLD